MSRPRLGNHAFNGGREADLQQRDRDHYGGETVEESERQGEYEAFDSYEEAEGEVEEERDARPGARVALVDHAAHVAAEGGTNEALEEAAQHAVRAVAAYGAPQRGEELPPPIAHVWIFERNFLTLLHSRAGMKQMFIP